MAEILKIDPSNLGYKDRVKILNILENDQSNLSIVAKHLSSLAQIDFAGQELDDEAIRIIGSRYNRGPDLSRGAIASNTSYGDTILKHRDKLESLLESPTSAAAASVGAQPVARGSVPVG